MRHAVSDGAQCYLEREHVLLAHLGVVKSVWPRTRTTFALSSSARHAGMLSNGSYYDRSARQTDTRFLDYPLCLTSGYFCLDTISEQRY